MKTLFILAISLASVVTHAQFNVDNWPEDFLIRANLHQEEQRAVIDTQLREVLSGKVEITQPTCEQISIATTFDILDTSSEKSTMKDTIIETCLNNGDITSESETVEIIEYTFDSSGRLTQKIVNGNFSIQYALTERIHNFLSGNDNPAGTQVYREVITYK